jgi:hypothetical protein
MVGATFLNVDTFEEVEADQAATVQAQAPGLLWLFAILTILVVGVAGFLETIF